MSKFHLITKKLVSPFLLVLLFLSCTAVDKDLGNGYFLAIGQIGYELGKKMPNEPTYSMYTMVVEGEIKNYAFDSKFILVDQKPWDSIPETKYLNLEPAKKIFIKSSFKQYFIVSKKLDSVYGPFKYDSFVAKRLELGVDENLKLQPMLPKLFEQNKNWAISTLLPPTVNP